MPMQRKRERPLLVIIIAVSLLLTIFGLSTVMAKDQNKAYKEFEIFTLSAKPELVRAVVPKNWTMW